MIQFIVSYILMYYYLAITPIYLHIHEARQNLYGDV